MERRLTAEQSLQVARRDAMPARQRPPRQSGIRETLGDLGDHRGKSGEGY
jgi:hypothetical protein